MRGQKVMILSEESIAQYRNWCIARGRALNTAKAYATDLKEFLKAVGDSELQMEEYEELAMSWLNLSRQKCSPKTTGRRLTSLRQFGRWAGLESPLADYAAPQPARPIAHPIPEGPTGIDRMIQVAKNNQQRALLGLCGFAGLRVSEALSTRIYDFDLQTMTLSVRGKGDKMRIVPLNNRAWSAISSAYVDAMSTKDGFLVRYKDRFARKVITNLGKKAQLSRPISSHDLRATFATAAYDHALDLRSVQELLGHSSSMTTEVYTGVTMKKMRKAAEF